MEYGLPIEGYEQQPVEQPFALPVDMPTKQDAISIRPLSEEALPTPAKQPEIRMIEVDHDPWMNTEFSKGSKAVNKLFGTGGEERFKTWPEKVVREGLTAAGDVYAQGTMLPGLRREDFTDIPAPGGFTVANSPADNIIGQAQAISALAGSGGLGGTGEGAGLALGSGPSLRPALKYKEKLYKGKEGQEHADVIPKELYPEFQRQAMSGEDISNFNFGFVNDKGQFLTREKALEYGINTGIIDPHAGKYGALTSTLMADSSKPGTAIEAMAKTQAPAFYSAVEHNVAAIPQAKMSGDQWLATLSNKPGVKPEELQWTGLQEFLESNKGKPVTKEQIQEHLASNKVELKEVEKGKGLEQAAVKDLESAIGQGVIIKGEKLYSDEVIRDLYNGDLKVSDLPTNLQAQGQKLIDNLGGDPTKYHSYQLPGGENYREMLLTLPQGKEVWDQNLIYYMRKYPQVTKNIKTLDDVALAQQHNPAFKETMKGISPEEVLATARASEKPEITPYKSSHWEEPNILAHVRMNDRNIDGKKSLHLEEIQSDWHQQGRDKGYKNEAKLNELKKQYEDVPKNYKPIEKLPDGYELNFDRMAPKDKQWGIIPPGQAHAKSFVNPKGTQEEAIAAALDKINSHKVAEIQSPLIDEMNKLHDGIPDAPFKKSWHELALKRMLREAAEKGYDRLSWTPGEAQAARYDLSKSIGSLEYNTKLNSLIAYDKNNNVVMQERKVPPEKLSDFVGKEAADKLINKPSEIKGEFKLLNNADLKIGGEGMKGFYDQIIPKALEKIGKEHGVKVQYNQMLSKHGHGYELKSKNGIEYLESGTGFKIHDPESIKAFKEEYVKPVHYIDIPQSLKDHAMHKGFPLFSKGIPLPLMPIEHDPFKFKPVDGNPYDQSDKKNN